MTRAAATAAARLGQRVRARLLFAASWLACRLPEGPLVAVAEWVGDAGTGSRRSARPRRGATCAASRGPRRPAASADARRAPRRPTRGRSSGSSARRSGTPPATTSRSSARPLSTRRSSIARIDVENPDDVDAALRAGRPDDLPRRPLRADRAARPRTSRTRSGRRIVAPMETRRRPGAPGLVRADAVRVRRPDRRPPRGAPRAARRAEARRVRRPRRRPRPHRRRHRGPVLRRPGADPGRAGLPRDRDRRAALHRRRLADAAG